MNCEDGICQFLSALGFELLRAPSLPPSLASFPQQKHALQGLAMDAAGR
jgi:hypothetical protein